ncbi:MAG: hypothetical protein ABTD50_06330 [Polyangiaceae bacterium]
MRQVEEALARQVIYGGDLVTNLMEVTPINEKALVALLAESLGLPPAPTLELPLPSDALRSLVPAEVATACGALPLAADGQTLVVAVADRLTDEAMAQLVGTLGLTVEQQAAPLLRIRQALGRAYGVPVERRLERLAARLDGRTISSPSGVPRAPSPARKSTSRPPPRPSTMPLGAAMGPDPSARPGASGPATPRVGSSGHPVARADDPINGVPPRPESARPGPREAGAPREHPVLLQRAGLASPSPRRRGPITFDMACREAEEAVDRDALLALYFDFARQFFDYSVLFLVHGDIAEGRDAFGSGAPRERVVGVGVPLDLPVSCLMSQARDTLRPVVARVAADGLDAELRSELQRPAEGEMAIIPLVVRSRPVALFLGDCGEGGIDSVSLQQVGACGAAIGRAFERLIMRRKKEGFATTVAPSPTEAGPATDTMRSSDLPISPTNPASDSPVIGSAAAIHGSPFMSRPPATNITVVRPLSRPPLPREDPESPRGPQGPASPDSVTGIDADRRSPGERGASEAGADPERPAVAARDSFLSAGAGFAPAPPPAARDLLESVEPAATKPSEGPIPPELDSGALFDMLGWEGPGSDPDSPPPSEAHAVPPHRPPSARSGPLESGLPSVIVDLDHELNVIVDRLIAGTNEEERGEAEGELLRQGERAMRVIMARFPGPVTSDRRRVVTMAGQPKPSECGVLLRLVARERKVALPFVLERLADPDPEIRGWATCLLSELPYVEALPQLFMRLTDSDVAIQAAAVHAIVAVGRAARIETRAAIREHARALEPVERAAAMRVMGQVKDPVLVPELVRALVDDHSRVVAAAHDALVQVSCQDFGTDARPWVRWWDHHSTQHRVEWLIDALTHDVVDIRGGAAAELRAVTGEYFGYSADLPLRDRERAQQRYRDWWATDGRARFRAR